MTVPGTPSGGRDVKGRQLSVGDYIRDPRKGTRILQVDEACRGSSQALCRPLEENDKILRWIGAEQQVTLVTLVVLVGYGQGAYGDGYYGGGHN